MKNARSDKRMRNTSKFISLILRHKPEAIGISLDEHGWADVEGLITGVNPWSKGGKTITENCQMLCADCNRRKSNI